MKRDDVAEAWKHGIQAYNKTMSTNGLDLYSYGLRIGYTTEGGDKVAIDFTKKGGRYYSMTTSNHVAFAKRYADRVVKPDVK